MLDNLGARAWGIASDAEGIIPAAVDEQLRHFERRGELDRVKAIYVTSYFDNPTSVTLSAPRRAELVELAERWSRTSKIYLIEDAAYRALRYAGDDLPSLRSLRHDRRNGDCGRDVFQIVFARHPGRLGHFAARIGRAGRQLEGKLRFRLAPSQPAADERGVGDRGCWTSISPG